MSRIPAIDLVAAQGKTAETLAAVHGMLGGVPNMFLVAAQAPAVLDGLVGLNVATAHGALGGRVRAAIALTVAQANGCDYCLAAHTFLGQRAGLDESAMAQARLGAASDAKIDAILVFARTLVLERGRAGDAAVARLRLAGVSDAEVLEIVANVTLNIFTNYLNIVAGTDIDFPVVRAAA